MRHYFINFRSFFTSKILRRYLGAFGQRKNLETANDTSGRILKKSRCKNRFVFAFWLSLNGGGVWREVPEGWAVVAFLEVLCRRGCLLIGDGKRPCEFSVEGGGGQARSGRLSIGVVGLPDNSGGCTPTRCDYNCPVFPREKKLRR